MAGWQNEPFKIELKAGDRRALCMCGLSSNGPFCDGSHKDAEGDVGPHMVSVDEDKTLFVCGCRESSRRPFCDGTHKTL